MRFNESELYVEFAHNGARIQLQGADNYERLRGQYFDGIVMDEFGARDLVGVPFWRPPRRSPFLAPPPAMSG